MNGTARDTIDTAIGSLLAIVALAFGFVGWLMGVTNRPYADVWFFSAGILGVLAIGVVLDESRLRGAGAASMKTLEASFSWVLMVISFAMGVVGFIGGLMMGGTHTREWLLGGIILAIVAVGVMADEGRRLRAGPHGTTDEIIGGLLSLLAVGAGVVGFIIGITGGRYSNEWLSGGIIAALSAAAFMFDGERRAAVAAARQTGGTPIRPDTGQPYTR